MPKTPITNEQNCADVFQDPGVGCGPNTNNESYQKLLRGQEEGRNALLEENLRANSRSQPSKAPKQSEGMVTEESLHKNTRLEKPLKTGNNIKDAKGQEAYEALVLEEFLDRRNHTSVRSSTKVKPIQPQTSQAEPGRVVDDSLRTADYLTALARHNMASPSASPAMQQAISPLQNLNTFPMSGYGVIDNNANLAIVGGASMVILGAAALLIRSWRRSHLVKATSSAKIDVAQNVSTHGFHRV